MRGLGQVTHLPGMEEGHVLHGIPVFLSGGFLLWMHLGKGFGVLEATERE